MGISQLLRFMKPFIQPAHIQKYAGKRVGVDAYSWLHKGAYSCSMELCLNYNNKATRRYIKYFMHRINLLRHYKVIPVVVFDGANIPCKAATEYDRKIKRDANLASAKSELAKGNMITAVDLFQKAVRITPSMAHQLIQVLKSEGVEFVVAPYEADAQLAYLATLEEEQGGLEAVITEDSDLIAYCCKSIFFKMDRYGNGEELVLENMFTSLYDGLSFIRFDHKMLTGMCVLAGCDFLPSVPGIGIKRAYTLVSKYRDLNRVLSMIKYDKGSVMPEDYSKSFREAVAVFNHARIYDAKSKEVKLMKPIPVDILESLDNKLDFLGAEMPSCVASAIAQGNMDPMTRKAFANRQPSAAFPVADLRDATSVDSLRFKNLLASSPQCCFTFISAKNSIEESEAEAVVPVSRQYSNEKAALEKILTPLSPSGESDNQSGNKSYPDNNPYKTTVVPVSQKYYTEAVALKKFLVPPTPSKTMAVQYERKCYPANNPFKITKGAAYDNRTQSAANDPMEDGQCQEIIDITESEMESDQAQEKEGEAKIIYLKRKVEVEDGASDAWSSERVSGLTNVKSSDNGICTTPASQTSVNSKPNKKLKAGIGNRMTSRAQAKSTKNGKDGILRFFTRL